MVSFSHCAEGGEPSPCRKPCVSLGLSTLDSKLSRMCVNTWGVPRYWQRTRGINGRRRDVRRPIKCGTVPNGSVA